MKKRRWRLLAAALLAVVLLAAASRVPYLQTLYFGPMTCPASEEGMVQYAEDLFDRAQYGREITVLKTAQEGRAWAILYEEATTQGRYLMTFERQFFGLRLRQIGMNNFHEDGVLYLSGGWQAGDWPGSQKSRCVVQIYGDNRGGQIEGYALTDAPQAGREDLESDYILDLYILDGIESLPKELTQIPSA